jgi:hypothetical protein
MRNDIILKPDDVTLKNLLRLNELESVNMELRIFELSDFIDKVKKTISSVEELDLGLFDILSFISDQLSLPQMSVSDSINDDINTLKQSSLLLKNNLDRALLSSMLSKYFSDLGYSDTDFVSGEDIDGVFTYVKNLFSDEAYDIFSQDFDDPRVRYSRDFSECIRLLMSGEVNYSLLPFEERGGIRLPTVEEIILRNDLKVCAVTPVFGPDGMQDLKYALVSDRFALTNYSSDDDRYLEIRLPESSDLSISDVMSAASFFGHSIYRVNTLSIGSDDGGQLFGIVFRSDGKDFTSLLTYLTVFVPQYYIVGIYKNLE